MLIARLEATSESERFAFLRALLVGGDRFAAAWAVERAVVLNVPERVDVIRTALTAHDGSFSVQAVRMI